MKLAVKITRIFITALIFVSPITFAGNMGIDKISLERECRVDDCHQPVWELGAKAFYINVNYGHDPWFTERALIDTLTGYQQVPMLLKNYQWGTAVDAMYHFTPGKAFDLNIYYWDHTDTGSDILANGGKRTVFQRSKWVTGNLELHQVLPIADNNAFRVFLSVNYTYLNKQREFFRDIRALALNNLESIHGESNGGFYGAGPRWGGHINYNLPSLLATGFSLSAEGAAGVLLGRSRAGIIATTQPILSTGGVYRNTHQFAVVFEFDTRLAVNYSRATSFGLLGAELGWMAFDYLSAIEDKANALSTDVLYQGFFVGLRWQGG